MPISKNGDVKKVSYEKSPHGREIDRKDKQVKQNL